MTDRIAEVRQEGFYWVILGQNPPEIAYWGWKAHPRKSAR
jgi:hypothetical protein